MFTYLHVYIYDRYTHTSNNNGRTASIPSPCLHIYTQTYLHIYTRCKQTYLRTYMYIDTDIFTYLHIYMYNIYICTLTQIRYIQYNI